jgi:hypothetical protein
VYSLQEDKKKKKKKNKKVNIWTTLMNKKEANDSFKPTGILPQYGDPRGGWVRQDFILFHYQI